MEDLMTHYNIQINIQIVDDARAPAATRQYGSHSPAPEPKGERRVTEVAAVKVTAATEAEAFAKAYRMLTAAAPVSEPHLHRASCDDAGGNLMCGFPPGPSIASVIK
jgi:hypothetical protein